LCFRGSKLISAVDHQNLYKILGLFANVRTLILKDTGIKDLAFVADILCSKWLKCKRVDLTGHGATKEQLVKFTDILEGRSLTKDVPPFWLAVGSDFPELLTNTDCNPHTGSGCHCKSKRVVHVVATFLQAPSIPPVAKLPMRRARDFPPPPKESPPLPPQTITTVAGDFAAARQRLKHGIEQERASRRTVMHGDVEFVLVTYQGHFALVDFASIEKGLILEVGGTWLRVEYVQPTPSEEGLIPARAAAYCVGAECATPASYLRTGGGEHIKIRVGDFTLEGWVAAALESEWKWFPLNRCIV